MRWNTEKKWVDRNNNPLPQIVNIIPLKHKRGWKFAICDMDGLGEYYALWNKSEKHMLLYDIAYMWNLKKINKIN